MTANKATARAPSGHSGLQSSPALDPLADGPGDPWLCSPQALTGSTARGHLFALDHVNTHVGILTDRHTDTCQDDSTQDKGTQSQASPLRSWSFYY